MALNLFSEVGKVLSLPISVLEMSSASYAVLATEIHRFLVEESKFSIKVSGEFTNTTATGGNPPFPVPVEDIEVGSGIPLFPSQSSLVDLLRPPFASDQDIPELSTLDLFARIFTRWLPYLAVPLGQDASAPLDPATPRATPPFFHTTDGSTLATALKRPATGTYPIIPSVDIPNKVEPFFPERPVVKPVLYRIIPEHLQYEFPKAEDFGVPSFSQIPNYNEFACLQGMVYFEFPNWESNAKDLLAEVREAVLGGAEPFPTYWDGLAKYLTKTFEENVAKPSSVFGYAYSSPSNAFTGTATGTMEF